MFSRVMLALDLSELTPRILDVFYSVCLDPETEVYLLHVVKKAENFAKSSAYYKKTYSRLNGLAQDIQKAGQEVKPEPAGNNKFTPVRLILGLLMNILLLKFLIRFRRNKQWEA